MMQPVQINRTRPTDFPPPHHRIAAGRGHPHSGRNQAPDQLHFTQVMGILRCHRTFIISVAVAGTVLAGMVGLLIPSRYTATAEIMVDVQQADARGSAGLNPQPDETAIDTQVAMLTSRDRLRQVVESLAGEPGFPRTARPDSAAMARALDDLLAHLRVSQVRRSRAISISFTAETPQIAAEVANRVAERHIAGTVEDRRAQIRAELSRLEARAADLKKIMEQAAHPPPGLDEAGLAEIIRRASAAGQAYAGVLQRRTELRAQDESVTPEAHVLSRAAPPDRPSSPGAILFLFPALIASTVCGCLLAVLGDRLDRGMRSERDVTEKLGLPCVGLVPRTGIWSQPHDSLLRSPLSPYAEAVRSCAARLHLGAPPPSRTVLVSSSVPGEGKSTLAISLAVYAARLGRRTLLVDTDFRRPSSFRKKHAKHDDAISELSPTAAAEMIRRIPDLGFDYLALPRSLIDPLKLFWGAELQPFIRRMRDQYDCILIDGPPLLGATEASLLREMADTVLFVVKWRSTRREVAQHALDILCNSEPPDGGRAGAGVVSVVTQVDLQKHARYAYGDTVEALVRHRNYYGERTAARQARRAAWTAIWRARCAAGDGRRAAKRMREVLANSRLFRPFHRLAAEKPPNPPEPRC